MSKIIVSLSNDDGTFTAKLPWDVSGPTLIEAFCALMKGTTYSHSVIQASLEEVVANYQDETKFIQDNG